MNICSQQQIQKLEQYICMSIETQTVVENILRRIVRLLGEGFNDVIGKHIPGKSKIKIDSDFLSAKHCADCRQRIQSNIPIQSKPHIVYSSLLWWWCWWHHFIISSSFFLLLLTINLSSIAMDAYAFSTTTHPAVSSLLPKSFVSTSNHINSNPLHLLKPPLPSIINNNNNKSTRSTGSSTLSSKPSHHSSSSSRKVKPLLPTFSSPTQHPLHTHRRAATGYAAALLDAACCDGAALASVAKDARRVRRIAEVVAADEEVEQPRKGEVVRRAVEGGGFYPKLVVLVRMLAAKGKAEVVGEVMEEFGRLWEELCGIKRLIVVKDKSKSLVFEREPRFAM